MLTIDNSESTLARDVANDRLETLEVGLVKGTRHASRGRAQALHQEGDAEGVKAILHQGLNLPRDSTKQKS